MSQICICVANQNSIEKMGKIKELLHRCGLFVFNELFYVEPCLRKAQSESKVILSISDDAQFNNCEMLLLPDNCFYNGRSNNIPFSERMQLLKDVFELIVDKNSPIELFVGDSGTPYNDFEHHKITLQDFLTVSANLNSVTPPDLHLVISDT